MDYILTGVGHRLCYEGDRDYTSANTKLRCGTEDQSYR